MTDSFFCVIALPITVITHVFSQYLRSFPALCSYPFLFYGFWIYRWLVCKRRRDFNHCLVNKYSYRVQIRGISFQTQPLGFERNRTTACERIMKCRQFLRVKEVCSFRVIFIFFAGISLAFQDLFPCLVEYFFVCGVLPLHQFFN